MKHIVLFHFYQIRSESEYFHDKLNEWSLVSTVSAAVDAWKRPSCRFFLVFCFFFWAGGGVASLITFITLEVTQFWNQNIQGPTGALRIEWEIITVPHERGY